MKQDEVEKWINTDSGVLKRRYEDFPADVPTEDRGHIKRRKLSQVSQNSSAKEKRPKPSRSEGDVDFARRQLRRRYPELLPPILRQKGTEAPPNMANVPPSPRSSDCFAMPPPSRPSSQASSRTRSQNTGRASTKTSNPTYRSIVLRRNRIFIQHVEIPHDVNTVVDNVLNGQGDAVASNDNEIHSLTNMALATESGNEEDVIKGLSPMIFPDPISATRNLARDDKTAFTTEATPYFPPPEIFTFTQPTVSNPVPDILYGYSIGAFSPEEEMAQIEIDQQASCVLSTTTKKLYWGFFIIEFKSQATGGTIWSATNQCAGGGSTCTNALYRTFTAVKGREHNIRSDSISFSLAIDGQTASLYVHWYENTTNSFYCSRVRHYVLFQVPGVCYLKRDVDSIIHWGLNTRLPTIRSALNQFIARAQRERAAIHNHD